MNSVHINDVLLTRDQVIFLKRALLERVGALSPITEQEETDDNCAVVLSALEERFTAFSLLSLIDGQLDPTNARYAYNGELVGKYLRISINQHRVKFVYSKNIINALRESSRSIQASDRLCGMEIAALYELANT
jgi:hypothetical protein